MTKKWMCCIIAILIYNLKIQAQDNPCQNIYKYMEPDWPSFHLVPRSFPIQYHESLDSVSFLKHLPMSEKQKADLWIKYKAGLPGSYWPDGFFPHSVMLEWPYDWIFDFESYMEHEGIKVIPDTKEYEELENNWNHSTDRIAVSISQPIFTDDCEYALVWKIYKKVRNCSPDWGIELYKRSGDKWKIVNTVW